MIFLLSLQQNTPATQIRQLHLQGLYLPLADRQLQVHTIGSEGFVHDQTAQFRYPKLHPRQLAKCTGTSDRYPADQLDLRRPLQAFVGAAAIGPGEAAGAQLNAAIPADHQYRDLIAILRFDRCQNRPASGAAGFAIVIAAVLIAEFPGPAIVRGVQITVLFDERLSISCASDWPGEGDEAAFANLFAVLAKNPEG